MISGSTRSICTAPLIWLGVTGVAIGLSLSAGLGADLVNLGGLPQLQQFLSASLHPDLSLAFLQVAAKATLITFAYAVCSTVLSILIGLVAGVLTSEIWWQSVLPQQPLIRPFLRSLLAIPRAIHELIWGLFFVNIFGLDPLVAILGIAIPYGAIVAKVFSELLDETPRQPLTALLNSGVAPLTALIYTVFSQASLDLLSYTFYRFECSIRSATVLGIIGAGGLGYEILLSLQSLRYAQLWTLFYALFVLSGTVDLVSALLRRRLGSPSRLELNLKRRGYSRSSSTQSAGSAAFPVPVDLQPTSSTGSQGWRSWGWQYSIPLVQVLMLVIIPFSFWYIQADFSQLWSARTALLLQEMGRSAFPPRLTDVKLTQLWQLAGQTVAMSILAIAVAGTGGILLSFPAAHNFFLPGGLLSGHRVTRWQRGLAWGGLVLTRSILLICRAIPAPIWALVCLFVLFPGILPGAIALGIHNLGILGRLMAEVTENLDQRPLLALKAEGSPAALVFVYGVLPLTFTKFLAYILYRWEVCMRETVIVGLVGAGGLGRLLTEQLSSFDYRGIVVSLACFVVLTLLIDGISSVARRSLR